jgi:Protein of unknown function with HXXEE motif
MDSRMKTGFLILVLMQGLHAMEEYYGSLWEVFPPARVLSSLFSENLETGFLIFNIGLLLFGLWCWFFPMRKNNLFARGLIWFWILIETINGIGHPAWALYEKTYVPGLVTAPVLLLLAWYLSRLLLQQKTHCHPTACKSL